MQVYSETLHSHIALKKRMLFSKETLEKVRAAAVLQQGCNRNELCAYAAGSLGRLEAGQISDLDIFLFADRENRSKNERSLTRLQEIQALSGIIQVNESLKLPAISGDGRYFKIHEVTDLLAETGTSSDDSENFFTTRLLLLLESKCVVNDSLYKNASERVIQMYFRDGTGRKGFKPLFLLNDILRYWRTVCLNYERARSETGKPWWKKNLNLKFSRKLTVFSTVLAIIACKIESSADFSRIAPMTPMERFAYVLDYMADETFLSQFKIFLDDYEEFLAAKSHSELETIDISLAENFSRKAEQFDLLLHDILRNPKLDSQLVRYMII